MNIEALYNKYRGHIFHLCKRFVSNPADAEDVVQGVFIKAMKSAGLFRNESGQYTWLYRIAVNECLNFLKKNRREFVEFDESLWRAESLSEFSRQQRARLWNRLIRAMSGKERSIIFMYAFEGLSISEISDAMGISRQSVHKRWNKIRETLIETSKGLV